MSAFDLAETARMAGLALTEHDGKLRVTGPADVDAELLEQLRTRRDDILGALGHSPGMCAHCGGADVVIVSWSGEPFCRPCAQRIGMRLLEAETPWILERTLPTLDDTPPPAPPGCIGDPEGNIWSLVCRCGHHVPPGKGHDAVPVNYVPKEDDA